MTLSEWKSLGITEEFMSELKRRISEMKDQLGVSAGVNPQADSYRSGVINALQDVVDFHFDDEESHN